MPYKDREYAKQKNKENYRKNRDYYIAAAKKAYKDSQPPGWKPRKLNYDNDEKARRYLWRLREGVIALLGSKCVGCGITDHRLLTINHKNGGGTTDRKNRVRVYREIRGGKRSLDEYDLRCFNCNILYDYERGIRRLPISVKELSNRTQS